MSPQIPAKAGIHSETGIGLKCRLLIRFLRLLVSELTVMRERGPPPVRSGGIARPVPDSGSLILGLIVLRLLDGW